jgi:hypothetical protein
MPAKWRGAHRLPEPRTPRQSARQHRTPYRRAADLCSSPAPRGTLGVGDEPRIPIESRVTMARDRVDAEHGAPGQYASTNRVVRGPGRWSRLIGVVGVVGLLAGGLVWWAGGGEGDDNGGDEPSCGIAVDRERGAHIALFESVDRLETMTSGPKVWTRSASTLQGLSSEPQALRTSARLSLPETAAGAHLVFVGAGPPGGGA